MWLRGHGRPHLLKTFALAYDTSLQEQLPLMLTKSVVPLIQINEAAGFDVLKLDRLVRVKNRHCQRAERPSARLDAYRS